MVSIRMPIEQYNDKAVPAGQKRSFELEVDTGLGESVTMPVLQVAGASAGPRLLVMAGVHGDEYEGVETVLRLYDNLQAADVSGTVTLIPTANPLAYRGGSRTSPEDGLNMARVFPGNVAGAPTERIAYHLHHRFIAKTDFLMDLHSGGSHYAVSTLAGYYHNDESEAGRKSRAAALAFGLNLLWAHSEVGPGRTVSSALELGIPWLYTETYGGKRVRRADAEQFYHGMQRLMRHLGMLEGDLSGTQVLESLPAEVKTVFGDGNFDASAVCEQDGFFIPAIELNSIVRRGDPIGTIYGMNGGIQQHITAYDDGMLVMIAGTPDVRKGDPLYLLASLDPK